MKLSDLAGFYESGLKTLRSDAELSILRIGEEVIVTASTDLGEVLLKQGETVIGCTFEESEFWLSASGRYLWQIHSMKGDLIQLSGLKVLELHDGGSIDLSIAVDEKIRDEVAAKAGFDNPSIEVVAQWLSEQFIVHANGSDRAFQASHHNSSGQENAYTLIGVDYSLVLEMAGDTLWIRRLAPKPRNLTFSLSILLGSIRFEDATVAVKLASPEEKQKLERLKNDQKSYLALWEKYDGFANRLAVDKARQSGYLQYLKYETVVESSHVEWRFFFRGDQRPELEKFSQTVTDSRLEIDQRIPDWLSNQDSSHLSDAVRTEKPLKASLLKMTGNYLVLEVDPGAKPSSKGFIYQSIAGDEAVSKRRKEARDRINTRSNGLKQLCHLIEGLPVPAPRRRKIKPLSASARECFKGNPTDKQLEALDIALNSPDIALILGPPGTGKTQIISALQRRLAEESDSAVGSNVLVSSFQHDAVDNVVARSEVFGLPAIRVGRRDRAASIIDVWIDKQQKVIESSLAKQEEGNTFYKLIKALRTNIAILMSGGLSDSEFESRVSDLLAILEGLSWDHHIYTSSSLKLKLKEAISSVQSDIDRAVPGFNKKLIRSLRSLRVTESSFLDDGAERAFECLQQLNSNKVKVSEASKLLLEKLSDEFDRPDAGDLIALNELKMDCIEKLLPDYRPRALRTSLNEELLNTLKAISEEVGGQTAMTAAGVVDVLSDYSQVLSFQKGRVRESLANYTSTLGATCQGAVNGEMVNLFAGDEIRFETVVIDEAARANPLDLFIPMSLANRRIVLVGDHYQLPQMLDPEVEAQMLEEGVISESDQGLLGESLFKKLYDQLKEREAEDGVKRTVMLDTQFRMHPDIGQFVSEQFYEARGENAVLSGLPESHFSLSLNDYGCMPTQWVDIPHSLGEEHRKGTSWVRPVEAEKAAEIAEKVMTENEDVSVGVITFYAPQREEILRELEQRGICQFVDDAWEYGSRYRTTSSGEERIRVGSVDAFQGKEFDVVILSMTRSNQHSGLEEDKLNRKYGFLRKPERLNVAFSRARNMVLAVGDYAMFSSPEALAALPSVYKYATEQAGGRS